MDIESRVNELTLHHTQGSRRLRYDVSQEICSYLQWRVNVIAEEAARMMKFYTSKFGVHLRGFYACWCTEKHMENKKPLDCGTCMKINALLSMFVPVSAIACGIRALQAKDTYKETNSRKNYYWLSSWNIRRMKVWLNTASYFGLFGCYFPALGKVCSWTLTKKKKSCLNSE